MAVVNVKKEITKSSFTCTAATSIGTSYDKDKACTLAIKPVDEAIYLEPVFLRLLLTSVSSATKITMRVTIDSGGDECIFPDTQATISTGVTTAGDGMVGYSISVPWLATAAAAETWYLMTKTDAGTVTVASADLYSYEQAE
tara:strand:+ start:568 stop:993 length:426 start_codon:yes stop_codon:yes gene_type:complete